MNIVELKAVDLSRLQYVALSYVWGGPQRVTLLKENLSALQQDGSLKALPQTLADVFTEEQVYWVCEGGYGIEETDTSSGTDMARCDWEYMEEPRALGLKLRNQSAADAVYDPYALNRCIDYYQSKALTNQGDALDALSGVLQSIEDRTGETFLWGLARSTFDTGIWWDRSLENSPVRRRTCLTSLEMTSLKQHVPFPSWMWLGWERATLHTAYMYESHIHVFPKCSTAMR